MLLSALFTGLSEKGVEKLLWMLLVCATGLLIPHLSRPHTSRKGRVPTSLFVNSSTYKMLAILESGFRKPVETDVALLPSL